MFVVLEVVPVVLFKLSTDFLFSTVLRLTPKEGEVYCKFAFLLLPAPINDPLPNVLYLITDGLS